LGDNSDTARPRPPQNAINHLRGVPFRLRSERAGATRPAEVRARETREERADEGEQFESLCGEANRLVSVERAGFGAQDVRADELD
jgi:hypothetical protein